ncbi:2-succinyl-5-enolpyruvyl-6-hydroxy-3-cyclohexene-1-carboxylic-acid synthase [Bacillaceae bacterium S4-13-58]
MNHTEQLTRYLAQFVDEFVQQGLTDVVISPGSRSTPISLTFAEHEGVTHWMNLDERSAAFFALGMAKEQKRPVALICTSGTAVANYMPAVVEAFYSHVPLLVITADRPHELREVGAPQTIHQPDLFGAFVKWFHDLALPESTPKQLTYVRSVAARSYHQSHANNPGPVHLNVPLREPLIPDFSLDDLWKPENKPYHHFLDGEKQLSLSNIKSVAKMIDDKENILFVCGPQTDKASAKAIARLAAHAQIPLLADPLSQIRAGDHPKDTLIETYDALLKIKRIKENWKPDVIIRFGAMPISKPYLQYVQFHPECRHIVIEESEGYREPAGLESTFIYADSTKFAQALQQEVTPKENKSWLINWSDANQKAREEILSQVAKEDITEGSVMYTVCSQIPNESILMVGNSMPVRDLDSFFLATDKTFTTAGNRGANGIDGITSTALGMSTSGKRVTLVIGDLSFYHDLNGLLVAKQYGLNVTVVLVNNNGGGIFSFLPQSQHPKHFEVLFGTPLDLDFSHAIQMYGGSYTLVEEKKELNEALIESYSSPGLSVIEVKTNRQENVDWHRALWKSIEQKV